MVYKSTRQLTVPREISLHTQMRSDMEALKIERIKQRNDSVEKYENGEFKNDENKASEMKMNQDLYLNGGQIEQRTKYQRVLLNRERKHKANKPSKKDFLTGAYTKKASNGPAVISFRGERPPAFPSQAALAIPEFLRDGSYNTIDPNHQALLSAQDNLESITTSKKQTSDNTSPSRTHHKKTPQQFTNAAAHLGGHKPSLRKPSLNDRMETIRKRTEGLLD